jgi:hypothetical protein
MTITREDIITVDSWSNIPYETWEGGDLPRAKLVYVIPERLADFVKRVISERCTNEYVVISAESDYGLVSQEEHPVNKDMSSWLELIRSQRGDDYLDDGNYESLFIPPRCVPENCKFTDLYSLKCAMFTHSTFPHIPPNMRILTTNTDLEDARVTKIPFGIRPSTRDEMFELHKELFDRPKADKLYVNFTSYTLERRDLLVNYRNRKAATDDKFIVIEESIEWSEYIRHMSECKFVLCPEGNGIDCYRNLEAHYLGCAPVMKNGSTLFKLPHFEVPTLFNLGLGNLTGFSKIEISNWAKLSSWKDALNDCR